MESPQYIPRDALEAFESADYGLVLKLAMPCAIEGNSDAHTHTLSRGKIRMSHPTKYALRSRRFRCGRLLWRLEFGIVHGNVLLNLLHLYGESVAGAP